MSAPRMSAAWARFYAKVFEDLEVLDLDAEAAEDGARLARDMARRGFKLHNADAAVAGCAARVGASVIVTTDGEFTELRGIRASTCKRPDSAAASGCAAMLAKFRPITAGCYPNPSRAKSPGRSSLEPRPRSCSRSRSRSVPGSLVALPARPSQSSCTLGNGYPRSGRACLPIVSRPCLDRGRGTHAACFGSG